MRTYLALLTALAALLLLSATPAFADPGAPGLDRASTSVYSNSGEPPVIGRTPPVPREPGVGLTSPELETGGTNGRTPEVSGGNLGGGGNGGDGGGNKRLPFTGYAAALVLAAGLGALLFGLVGRMAARRPSHA